MRQATLSWGGGGGSANHASSSSSSSSSSSAPLPPPPAAAAAAALEPVRFDVDSPAPSYAYSTPAQARGGLDQIDPALFDAQDPPAREAAIETTSGSCSANSNTSTATAAAGSTQPTTAPPAQVKVPTQPAVHPFFQPPSSSSSSSSRGESVDEAKRPTRNKARISYREDLKAVLRADAAQEAARVKDAREEKRLAKADTAPGKKVARKGKEKAQEREKEDEFELIEARVAPASSSNKAKAEDKPLGLAVKGTPSSSSSAGETHPFFAKKAKPLPAPALALPPIEAKEQQGEEKDKGKETKPASWSLFSSPRISSGKPKKQSHALWPSSSDTHVVGLNDGEVTLLAHAREGLGEFRQRWTSSPHPPRISPSHPPQEGFIRALTSPSPSSSSDEGICVGSSTITAATIDDYLASHVPISSIHPSVCTSHPPPAGKVGQLWSDLFRPVSAEACLGNEANAAYLSEWLRRLLVAAPGSVGTHDLKKRKMGIQRRVDKTKRRKPRRGYSDDEDSDDMADFIVDADEEEEEEECFARFGQLSSSTPPPPHEEIEKKGEEFTSLDRLTNCILLTGASGSGKTSTVYACAAAVGYEVFELYPGMGKRSGRELSLAVGDLARNHMVSSAAVRQSLILIEEADTLFDEDKGFWPAVIELVAESKRPVVIVAEEQDLVPMGELPLQQALRCEKPKLENAVAYLQTVAARMGRFLEAERIEELVRRLPGTETSVEGEKRVDLRQALQQVQFGHFAPLPEEETEEGEREDMNEVARMAELASAASVISFTLNSEGEVEAWGEPGIDSTPTRQMGNWTQLVPQPLASRELKHALTNPTIRLDYTPHPRSLDLERLGEHHIELLQTLLRPLFAVRPWVRARLLHPPEWMVADYAPFVRLIANCDEDLFQLHQSLHAQTQAQSAGRQTRNSRLSSWLSGEPFVAGYERWFLIPPEATQAAREGSLHF